MKPRVLLVNTNTEKAPYPVPPLGLCLLASTLEERFEVRVYDGVFDEGRGLPESIRNFDPSFIGFSIRNIDDVVMDRTVFYVEEIVQRFVLPARAVSDAIMILGGSGFSIFPAELMEATAAHYGIAGEGEEWLPVLLERLSDGKGTDDIPGLFRGTAQVPVAGRFLGPRVYPERFSEIDRWIDFSPYRQKGVYSVQTKRGCGHRCIYCTYPLIEGRRFRPRDPEAIAGEIEQAAKRLGSVTFEFVDSTFNDPAGHAEAVCRAIIIRKLNIRLRTMGINPRHCSDELFSLMREAGFVQIDATPDSASPRVLKQVGKGFTRREIERMARLITRHDMPTMWFFLFGGPGEDESTFNETLSFIDDFISPSDLVYMNAGMRIYPGTPLHTVAIREGYLSMDQSLYHPPVFYYSPLLGKERLDELIRAASEQRVNCLHALETTPSPEMLSEALRWRTANGVNEPMFRTLLRFRGEWRKAGRL